LLAAAVELWLGATVLEEDGAMDELRLGVWGALLLAVPVWVPEAVADRVCVTGADLEALMLAETECVAVRLPLLLALCDVDPDAVLLPVLVPVLVLVPVGCAELDGEVVGADV